VTFQKIINILLLVWAWATRVWDGKESPSHGEGKESQETQWGKSRVRHYQGGRWGVKQRQEQLQSTTKFKGLDGLWDPKL